MTGQMQDLGKERAQMMVDELQLKAWNGKEALLSANTLNEYHLTDLQPGDVVENERVGGNRIAITGQNLDGLTFDQTGMMVAIFSSDTIKSDQGDEVQLYYPHSRNGDLIGKSIFKMSTVEAANLLKRLAEFQQIDKQDIARGLQGMMTRFSMFGNAFQIHERDAAITISSAYQELD